MSAIAGQPLVRIRNLRFRYPGADHDVLRIPALDIRGQGLTAVTGPSGAGKSTLVELLAGTLSEHYDGTLEVLGHDWSSISKDSDRQRLLRRIGLIPQDYASIPGKSVRQALIQDLADAQVARAEHEGRIDAALKEVGLEVFADREVTRLSGGQRQRVAIARMLARDVDLVIADEPTANLDPELVDGVMALLRRLGERVLVIVITHDSHVAALCDRTVLLQPNVPYEPSLSTAPESAVSEQRRRPVILALVGLIGAVGLVGAAALALPKLASRSAVSSHPSSSPSASTSSGLTAPVVSCVAPGQRTGAGLSMAQPSGSVPLSSSPPPGSRLVAYSDGITVVLAPVGWTCTSVIGATGADTVTAVPKGDSAQAPTEVVTGGQDSASAGSIYADSCNYFWKFTGPNPPFECSPPPNGEIISARTEWLVRVEDVPGSGVVPIAPSNTNPISSVVVYTINTAEHERCVLPRKDVCDFVLGAFALAQKPVTNLHFFVPPLTLRQLPPSRARASPPLSLQQGLALFGAAREVDFSTLVFYALTT